MLKGHLDWPHAQQVFRLERRRTVRGVSSVEVVYGVTSLSPQAASAADLLELSRRHWGIENRLFHVRDTTFGEDACRVRTGHAPQNLAALRNASITLLNQTPHRSKAAALRRHAACYHEAVDLIQAPPQEN